MTKKQCSALAGYITSEFSKSLTHLSLDENDEIGTDGIFVVADAIASRGNTLVLENLSVCNCEITGAGALRLSKVVTRLSSFKQLKIDGNQINGAAVEIIQGLFVRAGKVLEGMLCALDFAGSCDKCHPIMLLQKWRRTTTMAMRTTRTN
jgi:hypothetical protein